MDSKGIVHISEPSLREEVAELCLTVLSKELRDIPVVYMKQPKDKKKCWLSLYQQLRMGLELIDTKYVGICEHDCLYTHEHLSWMPPTDDKYYYNLNHWLVQWGSTKPEFDMMYSYWPKRLALSQLVCNRELLLRAVKDRLHLLEDNIELEGEFGALVLKARKRAKSGNPSYLQAMDKYLFEQPKKETFRTENPNVDIRHTSNSRALEGEREEDTLSHIGASSKK
jgi:hypothetical protein